MPDDQRETSSQTATGTPSTVGVGYDFSIHPAVRSLDGDRLAYLSETLRDLIGHRIEGINYAEGRRSQFLTLGGAVAAVGIALLPLASGVDWVPLRAVYIEVSLGFLAVGGAIWIAYAWQTNYDYPFKRQLSIWKWFYHEALPDSSEFGPGLVHDRGQKRRKSEYRQVTEQWSDFSQQAIGLSTPQVDATQDLKQLYRLHVNERYKNLFLTQLRNILMRGLGLVAAGAVLVFVITLLVYEAPESTTTSKWTDGGVETSAMWKASGAVRTDGLSTSDLQFRLQGSWINRSSQQVTLTELVMLDRDGDAIPVELAAPIRSVVVAPGETVRFSGYFWVAGSDHLDMKTLVSR